MSAASSTSSMIADGRGDLAVVAPLPLAAAGPGGEDLVADPRPERVSGM